MAQSATITHKRPIFNFNFETVLFQIFFNSRKMQTISASRITAFSVSVSSMVQRCMSNPKGISIFFIVHYNASFPILSHVQKGFADDIFAMRNRILNTSHLFLFRADCLFSLSFFLSLLGKNHFFLNFASTNHIGYPFPFDISIIQEFFSFVNLFIRCSTSNNSIYKK